MAFITHGRGQDSDAKLIEEYKISDMDSLGQPSEVNPHYFGYVNKDGGWYITKLTNTAARYTRGNTDYDANWGNRAALTYYNFENIF